MEGTPIPVSPEARFTSVWGEDWNGLYLDGELICQGHSISARDLLDTLGYELSEQQMPDWYTELGEPLPQQLDAIAPARER